jgi:hypothetical protein
LTKICDNSESEEVNVGAGIDKRPAQGIELETVQKQHI